MPLPLALRSICWFCCGGMAGTSRVSLATILPAGSRNSTVSRNGLEETGLRLVARSVMAAPLESGTKLDTVTSTARSESAWARYLSVESCFPRRSHAAANSFSELRRHVEQPRRVAQLVVPHPERIQGVATVGVLRERDGECPGSRPEQTLAHESLASSEQLFRIEALPVGG